jgi:hypothetical protein
MMLICSSSGSTPSHLQHTFMSCVERNGHATEFCSSLGEYCNDPVIIQGQVRIGEHRYDGPCND